MARLGRSRRAGRMVGSIWPGFVDAMTALLMVLMFVLTIFMVVQSVLREEVTSQEDQLSRLGLQIAGLSQALALSEAETDQLGANLATRESELAKAVEEMRDLDAQIAALDAARNQQTSRAETAEATAEARAKAAEELRKRLDMSQAELTAMTLSLEESRQKAEETLTLLAAAQAAKAELEAANEQATLAASTKAERQAALLALARERLAQEETASAESQRRVALLNEQIATLNRQMSSLQAVLDVAESDQKDSQIELADLGKRLNAALLRANEERGKRLDLEQAERERLEAEKADLQRYRSEFFGRMSEILSGREGVSVVGDRFVFSSEVLFPAGEAVLGQAGRDQIARVAELLKSVAVEIPPEIDWVIRVDGHTDDTPLSGLGRYRDNWELSQARALAVVRFMVDELGFPPDRLAATGFAEFRPVDPGQSPEARARNRRIELKLTER